MPSLEIHGTAKLRRALLEASGALHEELVKALEGGVREVVRNAKANITGGNPLNVRTGFLRSSLRWEVDANKQQAIIGTNVPYAPAHEYGTTIKPKNAKFLALPLPIGARKGSPRSYPNLRLATTLKGQWLLVDEKGEAQFLLRRQVKMPERPWLRPALKMAKEKFRDLLQRAMTRAFERSAK